jgi:hypothetical protein
MKTVAEVRWYGEQLEQPGGSEWRRGREGKERRVRGFIGEVLMAITREKSTGVLLRRPFPLTEREGRGKGR